MYKIRSQIIAIILAILVSFLMASAANAAKTVYLRTALTGGAAAALDGIDGAGLLDGDVAIVMASSVSYIYLLDADSAASESSPTVISPDSNAGDKRWVLQPAYGANNLDLLKGTYTNGYLCKYTSSGTLLDCNVDPSGFQTAITFGTGTETALASAPDASGGLLSVGGLGSVTQAYSDILAGIAGVTPANNGIFGYNNSGTLGLYTNHSHDDSAAHYFNATDATKLFQYDLQYMTTGKKITYQPTAADNYSYKVTITGNTDVTMPTSGTIAVQGGALGTPSSGTLTNCTGLPIAGTTGWGTGVATAAAINVGTAGALTTTLATGTQALGTSEIAASACASVATTSATGVATTDVIDWGFNGDPTSTTGYTAGAMLTIIAYPTANNVNFKVCNNTASAITPSAVTLNWRVRR